MRITTEDEYRRALERADALRTEGVTAPEHPELADVEAALAAYEALPDQPGVSKGRPPR